jgi:heme A synthase
MTAAPLRGRFLPLVSPSPLPRSRSSVLYARYAWSVLAFNVAASAWGAFVRASGSGAGCGAHWPTCNGEVVPRAPRLETVIEFTHRLTAGLATVLVVTLAVWAWRAYPKSHPVRAAAATSVGFIASEALIGAGLVLFGLVKNDASPLRAVAMGLHLMNTFLLLGSLAVTAAYATFTSSRSPRSGSENNGPILWALAAPLLLLVGAGATGAIAALGDTLFHSTSLAQGLRDDGLATAHLFVRLRALHPLLAGLAAVAVIASTSLVTALRSSPAVLRAASVVRVAIVAQVIAGVVNLVLLAPVGMQIVHLVLADAVWIAVVLLGARAMQGEAGIETAAIGVPAE